MDSENRRLCRWWKAADLIRPMKTEKWCGDNLFGGVSAPFFDFTGNFIEVCYTVL